MNKYLKRGLLLIIIVGATAFTTTYISAKSINIFHNANHDYNRITIEDILLISCDCKNIKEIIPKTSVKESFSLKDNREFKFVLRNCNAINTKEISKSVLDRLITKRTCIKFNIDVKLYNKQNDFASFKINNCNIELNEKL